MYTKLKTLRDALDQATQTTEADLSIGAISENDTVVIWPFWEFGAEFEEGVDLERKAREQMLSLVAKLADEAGDGAWIGAYALRKE